MNVSHSCNNNLEYIFYCPVFLCASQDGTSVDECITIRHDLGLCYTYRARRLRKYVGRMEQETVGKTTN
jgi:hypothetical protein